MTKHAGNPVPLDDHLCYAIYSAGLAIQRIYKPLLDDLGLTYPQYLVLNILWGEDGQTVGRIAEQLALESSTLTPMLKRLETAGLLKRSRNPDNERQVVITLTKTGHTLRSSAACIRDSLLEASDDIPAGLDDLNRQIKSLRDKIYKHIGGWNLEKQ